MSFFSEFKQFAMRGNVVDLAVGVVIGAAFGKIVTAMVEKIIMPIVGFLTSGQNFAEKAKVIATGITGADGKEQLVSIGYGAFIQSIIDFIIVAFVIFLVVKLMNRMKKKEAEAAPAAPPADIALLTEIRDLLKQKQA